eukprot:2806235-Alexandrium_andersonii.AAC.1
MPASGAVCRGSAQKWLGYSAARSAASPSPEPRDASDLKLQPRSSRSGRYAWLRALSPTATTSAPGGRNVQNSTKN